MLPPQQQPDGLGPVLADKLCELLVSASYGDPLLGCLLAAALLPGSNPAIMQQVGRAGPGRARQGRATQAGEG